MNEAVLLDLGTVSEETKGGVGSLFECLTGRLEHAVYIPPSECQ